MPGFRAAATITILRDLVSSLASSGSTFLYLPVGSHFHLEGDPVNVRLADGSNRTSQYSHNVTIISDGSGAVLDAQGLSAIMAIEDGVQLTLQRVSLLHGGWGPVDTLSSVNVKPGATLFMSHVIIANCSSTGLHIDSGMVSLTECAIRGCDLGDIHFYGGGMYISRGVASLTDCIISECTLTGPFVGGGGLWSTDSTLSLTRCTIRDCSCITEPGTIHIASGGGLGITARNRTTSTTVNSTTLSSCSIHDCSAHATFAAFGGGIYAESAIVSLTGCSMRSCVTTSGLVGGIALNQSGINAASGGSFYLHRGFALLSYCTISGSSAAGRTSGGGGLYLQNGVLSLFTCTVNDCTVSTSSLIAYGGGLFVNAGSATLTNCTIRDCVASVSLTSCSSCQIAGVLIYVRSGVVALRDGTLLRQGKLLKDHTTYYLLLTVYYLLLTTYCLPLTTCYLLLTTYYSLLTTHYLLLTTYYCTTDYYYLPVTTHYSLLTTYYSLLTYY